MKNILKYSAIAALFLLTACLTGCRKEYDTDPYSGNVALSAIAPNPVMRGGVLRILGTNLEKVSEVRFAGDVSVKDFEVTKSGDHGELRVVVPVEGPQVGKVSIVTADGTILSTFADLTFTEPIEFDSFTPAEALSGDEITLKGEYLDNVREVIFGNDAYVTEFVSQSRHELKVIVPSSAVTGYIIVGDVNEIADPNTIPNQIYSGSELVIGDPTVDEAEKATYKSGEVITVTGAHLDMIEKLNLAGAQDVEFTVAEDGNSLTFTLPASASDGEITLVSYAGNAFSAGEIETVTVADLSISSLADDGRYKAGCQVEITGSDLDLVSKVDFVNANASFYLDEGKIIATLPAEAKDGAVTVTLESGKQGFTPEIEVVKPIVTGISASTAVAGKDHLTITGTDLDLVVDVKIGNRDQSFIACSYTLENEGSLVVSIPSEAYSEVITLTSAAGYETTTDRVEISYDEAVSIVFDAPSYALGKKITLTGAHLLRIESIQIKGKKVVDYQVRTDEAMSFSLPEEITSPGVYRLALTLTDGSTLTWPAPFEVTAPFTETFIWEGSLETGDYGTNLEIGGEDDWVNAGLAVGDVVHIYFQAADPSDWSMQLFTGHWTAMNMLFPDLPNPNQFNQDRNPGAVSSGYVAFEVTDEIYNLFTEKQWWGSALIVQGKFLTVTGLSFLHYGATETVLWEGSEYSGDDYESNIQLGGEDDWVNAGLEEGQKIRLYFTTTDAEEWQIQVFDGHWNAMNELDLGEKPNQFNATNSPDAASKGYVEFEATPDIYAKLTAHEYWGNAIILQGKLVTFTKITFM